MLVIAGLGLIVAAGVLHFTKLRTTTTTKTGGGVPPTTTELNEPPSDTFLIGLLGVGVVFVLSGAFFDRITKVTLPGGGAIELARAQAEAARAVDRALERREIAGDPQELAAKAATATSIAAARAFEITHLAAREPAAAESLAAVSDLDVDVQEIAKRGRIPQESWDRLAEAALEEVLGRPRRDATPTDERDHTAR